MSFAWPHLLLLLVLPGALLLWELRRRQQLRTTFHPKIQQAEAGQNQLRLQGHGATRTHRARVWLYLGLMCAVGALARPQWGRIEEPVFDQSREILIAIDLSRSMLAQDVKPSRLDRAKLLTTSLLEKLEGERVGLIVFSGTAFLQSPLSADYEILREFMPALDPNFLPEGGTNYRALLETTLQAFGTSASADRFLIVLSDGETTDDTWQEIVPTLQKKNIRAICLGIGTPAGAMIPDGSGAFVKDDRGAVVLSKLENTTLQELAQKTGGVYRDASTWIDLAGVIKETVEAGRKGEFVEKSTVRLVERYQWALAPALLFLLVSFWCEFPVRPRPRALKISATVSKAASALVAAGLLLGASPLRVRAQNAPTKSELSPLGKIVSRLSVQPERSGRDWAELARETVTWGQKMQTEKHPVTEGPVRDALSAVETGAKLDPDTADWKQLRSELEALLQKPDEPPPQDQQQKQDQDKQDQNKQDQQKQDQENKDQSQQDKSKDNAQKDQPQDQNQPQESPDKSAQQDQEKSQKKQDNKSSEDAQSAFGDMDKEKETPPPPPPKGNMQQVGGAPDKKDGSPEQTDPALAMPLQKLQKIREQDSPAQLFQLMQGKPENAPAKKGKNW
ncbi:MAG: VWA domain-containing protein [Cephaloticoccus sp.]|nr:VWA domain-containing protein [Cephaloticoccus sp.]MCF7759982.1 VWA domain-containing protein [Cephaloticoccus sp.]